MITTEARQVEPLPSMAFARAIGALLLMTMCAKTLDLRGLAMTTQRLDGDTREWMADWTYDLAMSFRRAAWRLKFGQEPPAIN